MMLTDAPARQKASTMQISTSSRSNSGVGSAMVPSLLPTLPGSRRRGGVRSSDKLAPGQAETPASTAAQQRNIESERAFYFLQQEKEAEMNLKPVIIAGTLVFATSAFAQGVSNKTPGHQMQNSTTSTAPG